GVVCVVEEVVLDLSTVDPAVLVDIGEVSVAGPGDGAVRGRGPTQGDGPAKSDLVFRDTNVAGCLRRRTGTGAATGGDRQRHEEQEAPPDALAACHLSPTSDLLPPRRLH